MGVFSKGGSAAESLVSMERLTMEYSSACGSLENDLVDWAFYALGRRSIDSIE